MARNHNYRSGYEIICAQLPNILTRKHFQTTSTAWHGSYYLGKMAKWNIEPDVTATITPAHMKPGLLSIHSDIVLQEAGCVDHEHYLCGDEQSVCGRYGQNALAPVSAVAFHNGLKYRFGDYKVSSESTYPGNGTYIPDFVAVSCPAANLGELLKLKKDTPHNMVIVGEAKTPWKHDLMTAWSKFSESGDDENIRHAFGQIVTYMQRFKMRYGFLTTYNYTIFLRQELRGGEPVLYFTRPIEATSSLESGSISIRQCFYYLLSKCQSPGDYQITSPVSPLHWIGDLAAYQLSKTQNHQEPITPLSRRTAPPATIYQNTPDGWTGMSGMSPLKLFRDGLRFRATILFDINHIEGSDPNHKSVKINGKAIRVVIEDDADIHGNPPYERSQEEFDYPTSEQKQDAREKRNVTFNVFNPHEDERDDSQKGKGLLFDALERARVPSRSEDHVGVDADMSYSQRDPQRSFNPESEFPAYKHRATDDREYLYQSDDTRAYSDMLQSPSPAARAGRERELTSLGRTDETSYANPYSNTPHSQYDTQRLSGAPQPADPTSRALPHRSRDKGKEKSERSEKSDEGRKLRSSGKSTDQQPPKKGGPSLSGRSSKKR
ncbi:hypothetical protein LOZ12_000584 [Ophidiomyces ophidiicola]|uniref:Uncharacterized protein n=1 Tax=Ophidiomyces ophidiicola TaxID=1387563 RepID=A0ACB8V2U3_9EURO|nr:hypothetical protein LOZ64_001362 [Ophidiomyces ophidiicola]KAI1942234.1 hypothetical protein LOZ62_004614 [Ophidiomyces ophidiicola]KAI2011091.1 hypothetical protein LOZ50_000886 [Ophidiomyces ophidiicola]KAI2031372.1 hypothetical protein LOZ45_001435 [Ophidiomyces ophidiicola]KAI2041011.1 hypothetical protein LOZ47_000775 [Ophidiomyces ophidiicola]